MINKEIITVVTGLPRSGTSLMMQLLHKSGCSILSDNVREKDISNPEGYFEYQPVKGIVKDNSFLKEAKGKAIKIVAPLPIFMDKTLFYRVIFMRRDIEEILRSQEVMLNKDQSNEREKFSLLFNAHIQKTYQFLNASNIPYIDVTYKNLIEEPKDELIKLISFLDLEEKWENLAEMIKPDLYRNKL